jgi:hypothetical protein
LDNYCNFVIARTTNDTLRSNPGTSETTGYRYSDLALTVHVIIDKFSHDIKGRLSSPEYDTEYSSLADYTIIQKWTFNVNNVS